MSSPFSRSPPLPSAVSLRAGGAPPPGSRGPGCSAPAPTAQVHRRDRGKRRQPFPRCCASGGSGRGGKLLPFLQQAQELLNWPHLEGLISSHLFHQVPLPQQSHGIRETTGSRITPLPAPPALAALRLLSALSRRAPGITGGSITVICHRGEGRG